MAAEAIQGFINETAKKHNGDDVWYCELIAGFIATNNGRLSALVYEKALELAGTNQEARQRIWERIRETLLKAIVTVGQARVLPAEQVLLPLLKIEDIPSSKGVRDWGDDRQKGIKYLEKVLGTKNLPAIPLVETMAPELGHFLVGRCVGSIIAEDRILNLVETESVLIVILLCSGLESWAEEHVGALIRVGGTVDLARAALQRAKDIAAVVGFSVKDMPNLEKICQEAAEPGL